MRDDALRELERAWVETRGGEVEEAYVAALIRRGLERGRVLLAAYLGSEAANGHLGDRGFAEEEALGPWVAGLARGRLARREDLAREACARAALAALDRSSGDDSSEPPELAVIVAPLRAWLASPAEPPRFPTPTPKSSGAPQTDAQRAAADLRKIVRARRIGDAGQAASRVAKFAAKRLSGVRRNQLEVRAAIQRALLPWVLSSRSIEA